MEKSSHLLHRNLRRRVGHRRGQAALEYLVTYGWAFVVVIITIGAFAYFGLLDPQRYLPDRCDFGEQLECVDYLLYYPTDAVQGFVQLKFINGFGEDITIFDIKTADGGGVMCDSILADGTCDDYTPGSSYVTLTAGQENFADLILDLRGTEYVVIDGDKLLVPILINFSRTEPDAPQHIMYGEVFASGQAE